jgi:CheY-like chemotaxis protein
MKRILIVDDNVMVLKSMVDLVRLLGEELKKGPVEITTATSGPEAYRLMSTEPSFDLLITDYSMPDMSGLDLLSILGEFKTKKVLLSLIPLQISNRAPGAYAGADEILLKPVDEILLKDILDRFL